MISAVYRRTKKLAIFKFNSRRLRLQDFLGFMLNSRAAGGPQSMISPCGRDLINELDG